MSNPNRLYYPAIFSYQDKKILVRFPDLGVTASGENDQKAFDAAREVLGNTLYEMEAKQSLPVPTPLRSLDLHPNERSCLIDVFMPAVRLAQENRAVSRTLTVPAWLNTMAQSNNLNFSQVLQEALKAKLGL